MESADDGARRRTSEAGFSAPAASGWYPVEGGLQRYWDGTQWTDHLASIQGPSEPPPPVPPPVGERVTEPPLGPPPASEPPLVVRPTMPRPGATNDERTLAMVIHLLGLFTGFVGPLIVWVIKKDESSYLDRQAKEAINFQLTVILAGFSLAIAAILSFLLLVVFVGVITLVLTGFAILAMMVCTVVFPIQGAVATSRGEPFRYPVSLRILR